MVGTLTNTRAREPSILTKVTTWGGNWCAAAGSAARHPKTPARTSLLQLVTLATAYHPSTLAKISGATMVASDSMTNFGVLMPSFPQVIFSFGTAPEYEP